MMQDTKQPETAQEEFVLTITDAAVWGVNKLIGDNKLDPQTAGLLVGASKGGCSGYMYEVRVESAPADGDKVLEINGVRVFVNEFSKPLVSGMMVDWISSMTEQRFDFRNPNATGNCGCGQSFST
jgi:iron-sulfur cluster assembly protein